MGAAAELFVKVSADVKGMLAGFTEARHAADKMGAGMAGAAGAYTDAAGRMRDASGKFVAGAKEAGGAVSNLGTIIKGTAIGDLLADGIRSAASAMAQFGTRSLKLAGELETNRVAFTTMLGSAQDADRFLRDLATFAANTPFELRGLTDSSKRLLAFGFSAQSIIPIMTAVGDAVGGLGGGKEKIDRVTLALGQMAAKGKVSAEEMGQLTEAGIKGWDSLAKAIGVSTPQAMKMAEKGAIDAATAIPAILQGMSAQFGGMMEKQAQTFNGALSNFQDATDQAMTHIGQAMIDGLNLTPLLQQMSLAINNLTAAFTAGGLLGALDLAFGDGAKAAMIGIATVAGTMLAPSILAAAAAFTSAAVAAAPMIAAGLAVAAGAYVIMRNWDTLRGMWMMTMEAMGGAVTWVRNQIAKQFSGAAGVVGDALMYINMMIRETFGVDIAARLGVGLGKIRAGFSSVGQVAAEQMSYARWAVQYAAEDIAANFTGAFQAGAGAARLEVKKLTAELMGLKKAGASTDDVKKKADALAAAQKKAAREAAAHRRELDHQYKAAQASYDKFEQMAMALGTVSRGLAQAEAEAARLGRSFDLAGAKAAAIKDGLSQVESAFGKFSPQAVNLRTQLFELQQQSANGGKATAEAFKALDGASLSFEQARLAAQLLGTEFDASSTAANEYRGAVTSLIQQGLKPGNPILDEAVKKYRDAAAAVDAAKFAALPWYEQLKAGVGAVRDIVGAVDEMASVFGLSLPPALLKAITGGMTFVNALVSIIGVIPTVINAVNAMAVALSISTGGVYAILVGITALAAGAVYLYETMTQAEQAAKKLDETLRSSVSTAVGGALRAGAQAFADGAANYQEVMRTKLREGIIAGVLDAVVNSSILTGMGELIAKVARTMREGTQQEFMVALEELRQETEKTFQSFTGRMDQLLQGVRAVLPETNLLAGRVEKYTQDAAEARREASRAADDAGEKRVSVNEGSQQAIMRQLERMAADDPRRNVLLAQLRVLQGRASASDLATVQPSSGSRYSLQPLRGMATGGLVTGPVVARMGEGGRNEAVLPLNENVYRQIGQGIAAAGGGGGATVQVNYYGSGKWTREDAQGLGRLLVSELRAMGVRA